LDTGGRQSLCEGHNLPKKLVGADVGPSAVVGYGEEGSGWGKFYSLDQQVRRVRCRVGGDNCGDIELFQGISFGT
jgi:hypothetical protein